MHAWLSSNIRTYHHFPQCPFLNPLMSLNFHPLSIESTSPQHFLYPLSYSLPCIFPFTFHLVHAWSLIHTHFSYSPLSHLPKLTKPSPPFSLYTTYPFSILNPSIHFMIDGPHGDSDLTGCKIIIDAYRGWGVHDGGVFSEKNLTKTDQNRACMTIRLPCCKPY